MLLSQWTLSSTLKPQRQGWHTHLLFKTKIIRNFLIFLFVVCYKLLLAQQKTTYSNPNVVKYGIDYKDICVHKTGTTLIRVGWLGLIQISHNRGISWRTVPTGEKLNFKAIAMSSDFHIGIAVGDSGMIMRTTNRGESWQRIKSPTRKNLNAAAFSKDEKLGVIGGDGGVSYETKDKGLSWTYFETTYDNDISGVILITPNDIILTGSDGSLLKKINDKWKDIISTDTWEGFGEGNITSLITIDSKNFIAATSNGQFLKSNDGGVTWKHQKAFQSGVKSMWFDSLMKNGWAVTDSGQVYKTENNGEFWRLDYTLPDVPITFEKIIFTSDCKEGWIIGRAATYLHTTNAGQTWEQDHIPTLNTQELYISGNNKQILEAGSYGNVQYSYDEGNHWDRLSPSTFKSGLWCLEYNKPTNRIYVAGDSLIIASITYWRFRSN